MKSPSQNDLLASVFRMRPLQWIEMPYLAQVITPTGIGAAVHSRVSDLRAAGMNIEHRNETKTVAGRRICCSRYRYLPAPVQLFLGT